MSHQLPELPEPMAGCADNMFDLIYSEKDMRAYAELAIEPYDEMLRALCCYLSVGGYNSNGLIPPDVADKKIRDGIGMFIKVERQRAIASVKREPLSEQQINDVMSTVMKITKTNDDGSMNVKCGALDFVRAVEQFHGIGVLDDQAQPIKYPSNTATTASREDGDANL